MKINWDEAPKEATHCDTKDEITPWMQYGGGRWWYLSINGEWDSYNPSVEELTSIVERPKCYYVLTYREDSFSMGGRSQTHIKAVTTNEATANVWTEQGCEYQYKETLYKP